jgi:hypothetical protein
MRFKTKNVAENEVKRRAFEENREKNERRKCDFMTQNVSNL